MTKGPMSPAERQKRSRGVHRAHLRNRLRGEITVRAVRDARKGVFRDEALAHYQEALERTLRIVLSERGLEGGDVSLEEIRRVDASITEADIERMARYARQRALETALWHLFAQNLDRETAATATSAAREARNCFDALLAAARRETQDLQAYIKAKEVQAKAEPEAEDAEVVE